MCSNSSIGITIGCLNVAGFLVTALILTTNLTITDTTKINNEEEISTVPEPPPFHRSILVGALVICITMTLMSVLLVVGIIRNRYSLMTPWIVFTFIGLICNSLRCIMSMIPFRKEDEPDIFFFKSTGGCMSLCLQIVMLYVIYKLYKDMCSKAAEDERELDSFDGISETD